METYWEFEHAVECQVSREFAWQFWTDVDNWAVVDPGVEWVELDGPFAAGTRGRTKPSSLEPTDWRLAAVDDGQGAVVELAVPGAVLRFSWAFEDSAGGGTLMTQRATLEGERAGDYAEGVRGLEQGIPPGMEKLAAGMVRAAAEGPGWRQKGP